MKVMNIWEWRASSSRTPPTSYEPYLPVSSCSSPFRLRIAPYSRLHKFNNYGYLK